MPGLDVFPLLAPVPPEQPALPEDLDPWPSFEEEVDFDSNDVEDAVLSVEILGAQKIEEVAAGRARAASGGEGAARLRPPSQDGISASASDL